jgi:hypothetical protein
MRRSLVGSRGADSCRSSPGRILSSHPWPVPAEVGGATTHESKPMRTGNLIRVGDTIINLDNVMMINLDWVPDEADADDEPAKVVFEFTMRGSDELEEGQNIAQPYIEVFSGDEAVALRRHLKALCPDLLSDE